MKKRMEEIEKIINDPTFDDFSEEYYELSNEYNELFVLTEED